MRKKPKSFPACVYKHMGASVVGGLSICSVIAKSFTIKSDYKEKDLGFITCKCFKSSLYFQINATSHLYTSENINKVSIHPVVVLRVKHTVDTIRYALLESAISNQSHPDPTRRNRV